MEQVKLQLLECYFGILKKDEGIVNWNGLEVDRKNVNFGYLPEERGVYPKVKIKDQLMYFAKLKGMTTNDAKLSIEKWSKKLKVEEYLNIEAEKLSKGNNQKIQFITSVVHNPELIVLDEPFSGLDPVNTKVLKDVINDLVLEGKYIIMSSHQMDVIEEFCDELLILNKGQTILQGNLKQIKKEYKVNTLEIETNIDIKKYILDLNLELKGLKDEIYTVGINDKNEAMVLLNHLILDNILIEKFEIKKPTLNEIFIEKVGE